MQDIFSSVTDAHKKGYKFLFSKDKKTHVSTKYLRNTDIDLHVFEISRNNVNTLTSKINSLEIHEGFLQRQVAMFTITQRRETELELAL